MNKSGNDPKVKKTLVRNYEQRIKSLRKHVVHDVASSSGEVDEKCSKTSQKENELNTPTLCSSEALANYLSDVKKSLPTASDVNACTDKAQLGSKVTKKLNFHFNDRIYKNLIELNASVDEVKPQKDRRPMSGKGSSKRDLEPNLEDFSEDEEEIDSPPNIPVMKPKFKPVRYTENSYLHRLVASFENL